MTGANDLPQDIWELIAAYIPEKELNNLIAVNRQLLNIALDERYRVVSWVDPDKDMIRRLKRLGEPAVAGHVRRLHIQAWFMKRLLAIPLDLMDGIEHDPAEHKGARPRFKERIRKVFRVSSHKRLTSKGSSEHHSDVVVEPEPSTDTTLLLADDSSISLARRLGLVGDTRTILSSMLKAMELMVYVKEFVIEWRNLPLSSQAKSFLSSANSALLSNLCILSISCHLTRLESMLPLLEFSKLEELKLNFDFTARDPGVMAKNEAIMKGPVASFIHRRSATLRTLQITSMASGDHASLFAVLSTAQLPQLNKFVLEISFAEEFLSDPRRLVGFLERNKYSLLHLEIMEQKEWDDDRKESAGMNLDAFWTHLNNIEGPWFPTLRTLRVTCPLPSPNSQCADFLRHIPSTLTDIRLAHRFFTISEISHLVQLISERVDSLTKFHLEVDQLNPDLIRLLSKWLGDIYSLTLIIEKDDSTIDTLFRFHNSPYFDPNLSFFTHPSTFPPAASANHTTLTYPSLYDLGIYLKSYRRGLARTPMEYDYSGNEMREWYLMWNLKECIGGGRREGGIQSFKGTGHTIRGKYW